MMTDSTIECPVCEWQPDGKDHWSCSCGFVWNTFDTRAKCPNCHKQWEETYCPGCGKTTPHKNWYVNKSFSVENNDIPENLELRGKKKLFEGRLISLGIKNYRVSYLPFLDHSKEQFQTPQDVGCRMLILYAIAYSVHHLSNRQKIISWLEREHLWNKVSNTEKNFLNEAQPGSKELVDLSWRIEAALTLGWVLNLFDKLHEINRDETDEEMELFYSVIPPLGAQTKDFLDNLHYRDIAEVYRENLVNEAATAYFRDLIFNGKKDETHINRMVSYERHRTLNWVRQFSGISDWDDTETST